MKGLLLAFLIMASSPVLAQTYIVQCGAFRLEAIPGAMNKINGQTVTSQKIKMLGKDGSGMKIDMGLMPARDGNNYGFQYIHRPGSDSRFLNVQLLQASMDAPRVIGSFPCVKVAD